jgi:hypothetical protein
VTKQCGGATVTTPDRPMGQVLPFSPPYAEVKVWHLVYHLAPFKRRKIALHYHLDQLRKYAFLFNGRKILSCMTGDTFLPVSYVKAHLPNPGSWEIVDAPNNPLHEATSMVRIFDDLFQHPDDQAFMYAHGKGISHEYGINAKWIEYLYEYTFGSFDRVNALLTRYPIVGPFLWRAWFDEPRSINDGWLYPGTFFAARCEVFSRMPWRERPIETRYWLEQLPGYLFHKQYLGNVSNAIFGDTREVPAVEANLDTGAFEASTSSSEDAFWTRFDAALAGRRYFSAETKIA